MDKGVYDIRVRSYIDDPVLRGRSAYDDASYTMDYRPDITTITQLFAQLRFDWSLRAGEAPLYDVRYRDKDFGPWIYEYDLPATHKILEDLSDRTKFEFQVRAKTIWLNHVGLTPCFIQWRIRQLEFHWKQTDKLIGMS